MLKIGLIGCGFMGSMHKSCYDKIEGVKVVAVADIRPEKAKALASQDVRIYGDGKELIENETLDIIDVCLPTYLHAEYAIMAMEKAGYVFVEKPVALTAEQGERMLEKSRATGAQVQVGQVIRFWDEYVELKKIIESGKYGRVVNANFRRISPRPDWGYQDWLLDYQRSGGAGQDLHIHDIDYVLSLFGEPKSFHSIKNCIGERNSYVNTLMQYESFPVTVEGTWDLPSSHPFEASFRVVLEDAVIENGAGGFLLYDKEGAKKIEIEKAELGEGVSGGNISDLGGYYNELLYFCDKAVKGEKIDRATLADGVGSLKFVLRELGEKKTAITI